MAARGSSVDIELTGKKVSEIGVTSSCKSSIDINKKNNRNDPSIL